MVWKKLGLIVKPDPDIWWMSHYAGPRFVEVSEGNALRILVMGRDGNSVSRIGIVEVSKVDPVNVKNIQKEPLSMMLKGNGNCEMWYAYRGGADRFGSVTRTRQTMLTGPAKTRKPVLTSPIQAGTAK